jgi:GNAT superfamily N-acetyltransferase
MHVRPFERWEDLAAMQAVCTARLLAEPGRAVAHPGDIAWLAGWPPRSVAELADVFLLWEQDDEVMGFASFDPRDGYFSTFVMPRLKGTDAEAAFEEAALAWATRDNTPLLWFEFEDELAAIERWRQRGFRPAGSGLLNLTRSLEDVATDGEGDVRVRPVADADVEDRASITHAAFGSEKPFEQYAAEYAEFRASPAYPHGCDLLLRDTDGRAAACCITWMDPVSKAGTFEPVATHPDLHRQGFGTALLLEGLRRFAAAGMSYVIIGADVDYPPSQALYRSVGFLPDRVLRDHERA